MSLKTKIENNLAISIGGFLLSGFLAGIAAFTWGLNVFGLEISQKQSLCADGKVKLTVDGWCQVYTLHIYL